MDSPLVPVGLSTLPCSLAFVVGEVVVEGASWDLNSRISRDIRKNALQGLHPPTVRGGELASMLAKGGASYKGPLKGGPRGPQGPPGGAPG